MTDLVSLIQDLKIPPEKLQELAQTMQQNPFAAMATLQELGITPEILQKLLAAFMADPNAALNMAKQFGIADEALDQVKHQMNSFGVPPKV